MIRLHEFITKIRNCKTQAEERAEYQKEMAAIRESFAKNEETLRPRNVTKLLFINMSGQETNFGQMECLKLITAHSLIEKRIGYLGLTQLFHEKSELLMMATNRIRIDLNSNNNNIVGLVLCVLSQICTAQLAKDLHQDVLKCCNNSSAYIRKKAILTSIKIVKRVPDYIGQFLDKVSNCLEEKSHGVLLGCMAFLENIVQIDQNLTQRLVSLVPKIARAYRLIAQEHNAEYEIGGVQDPFLQVAILKFLRTLRKYSTNFDKQLAQILVICHDSVCSRISSNLKNGANAVLFECFQCFMLLDPTPQLRQMVANVLSKFISVKDANSKYLSLFNLNLMTKYDLKIAKHHRGTIFECLNENDILIRIMALDLLYVIAGPENSQNIVKDLLNVLWNATDEQFIKELALKICLIVEKHSINRRWHFDTILKVLVIADQAVKEESAKSLVYLVQSTPQLQEYCMAKLFFSTVQNPQNDALASVTLFLIGQLSHILLKLRGVTITETNILDLIEIVIFKVGINDDTISYGLTCLFKVYEKFFDIDRIFKMIRSFQSNVSLEVQKRACEYYKLLELPWDSDRKDEICVPVDPFRPTVQTFKTIPIGDIQMDLDLSSLKMPERLDVIYEEFVAYEQYHIRAILTGKKYNPNRQTPPLVIENNTSNKEYTPTPPRVKGEPSPLYSGGVIPKPSYKPKPKPEPAEKIKREEVDIFDVGAVNDPPPPPASTPPPQPVVNKPQEIDLMGGFSFESAPSQPPPQPSPPVNDPFGFGQNTNQPPPQPNNTGFGGDLLGFGSPSPQLQPQSQPTFQPQPQPTFQPQPQPTSGMGDLMGFGFSSGPSQPPPSTAGSSGFGFGNQPQPQSQPQPQNNNMGFDILGTSNQPTQPKEPSQVGFQPITNTDPNKIMAYQNQHLQIWMNCIKQTNDTTKIFTTYINKTNNTLTNLTIQAAVVKHVKLTINPLTSTTLQPFSKQIVNQTMIVINSLVGQKGVVMKMKLSYNIANQAFNFQEKISNFPPHV